jgi:flavin reductase (DIM6/NTAB) family NADH-FMN oxidoreductase RutF
MLLDWKIGLPAHVCAGSSANLAPYSYTNVVCHDPPIFTVGFAGSLDKAKDTLANLIDTGEC